MKPSPLRYTLLLTSLSPTLFLSNAYSNDDNVTAIDVVTVSASRIHKPVTALPNTVTIIDVAQIKDSTLLNDSLSGVLEQNVPGFGAASTNLTDRSVSLRGRNPLYLIDGVPQHNALRDGQRDGHTIDMDFIERIEVIHGSNAIQGIGATGGVINLITKGNRSDKKVSHDINLRLSSDDGLSDDSSSTKATYVAGLSSGPWSSSLGVSYHQRGLFYDGNGDVIGLYPTQGDLINSDSSNVFLKTRYANENHRIQLMFNDFDLEGNHDYRSVRGDRNANVLTSLERGSPRALVGEPARNEVSTLSLDYVNSDFKSWRLTTQLYLQDFKARYEGGTFGGFFRETVDGPAVLDQSQIESEKRGAKLLASRTLSNELALSFGLDLTEDESSQSLVQTGRLWVPKAKLRSVAPFSQMDYAPIDQLSLTAGVRYEDAEISVDDYTTIAAANSTFVGGGTPNYTQSLFNAGAVFDISDTVSIYTSYSEGFSLPDVGRVLRSVNEPGQDVDSLLNLKPIITDTIEVGLRFDIGYFSFEASLYESESDFGSTLIRNDFDIFEVSRQKTETDGFTVSSLWAFSEKGELGLSYAHIDGELDSNGDGRVDTDLDGGNIGPNKLSAHASYKISDALNGRLSVSSFSSREFNGPGIRENRLGLIDFSDGYTLVHANLNYRSTIGHWALGVQNLLDEQYVTYFSQTETGQNNARYFAGQGRTLNLRYNVTF